MKDWDLILRGYSSGEDSDAYDSLNVVSVQKNAKRVVEMLQECVPGLETFRSSDAPKPMGMNDGRALRDGLSTALFRGEQSAAASADEDPVADERVAEEGAAEVTEEEAAEEAAEATTAAAAAKAEEDTWEVVEEVVARAARDQRHHECAPREHHSCTA